MDSITRPTFSVPSGKVKRGTDVTLSTTTPDARILYTIDGSTPDTKDALEYASPIRINSPMTIKAITVCDTVISQVATASYTIDSVANEHDSRASKLRIYAQDRTIHLSETVGEVEVFTMDGHCVYRGYDTAISVKQSGLYVVSVAGKRWKVAVR
ncbi:MAG: chitobiase/beta-hexosaminidase C-terminal domain-containing protein [Bacteroidales bacterium]|nr:chitobiase/beta-hexosaminidase C-terminal domain-containing protein [Bacteroidales bacterium]